MIQCRNAHELVAQLWSTVIRGHSIEAERTAIEKNELPALGPPERGLVLGGSGAGAVSAREGARKLREDARVLAEGYASEYLLHGIAVPLRAGDALLLLGAAADRDGLLPALGHAATAEGLVVATIDEPSIDHPVLAQLPIIVRLQLLALSFSRIRSTDPDKAIAGHGADETLWAIGRPR